MKQQHGMPMPRVPDVIGGKGDLLERFMVDYLVGMFESDEQPLVIGPVQAMHVVQLLAFKGMVVEFYRLPPGDTFEHTERGDSIDLDLFVEIERRVGGAVVPAAAIVGIQAVRIPADEPCMRCAGSAGAAWLTFREVPW